MFDPDEVNWIDDAVYPENVTIVGLSGIDENANVIQGTGVVFDGMDCYVIPTDAVPTLIFDLVDYMFTYCENEDELDKSHDIIINCVKNMVNARREELIEETQSYGGDSL